MKRFVQVTLLVLSGLGLLHVSLFTDDYLRYVKEGMRPLLVASGAVLLALGVAEAWSLRSGAGDDAHGGHGSGAGADPHGGHGSGAGADAHGGHGSGAGAGLGTGASGEGGEADAGRAVGEGHHGHDHSRLPRVSWLLLLPALSLIFYAPPALGAYTAAREAPKAVDAQEHFDPLPATSPLPITLTDFTHRVQQDKGLAIRSRTVRMTGFVTPGAGSTWELTRIILSCCAADAQSVKVRIYGVPAPRANTWVSVTGTWHPGGTLGTASAPVAIDVRTLKKVRRPVNGYQDALPIGTS
ncbi:TIGR03943 family putative permease subunit [Streptomyces mangrovisoli]|uniref:TIGR03943 family protein n=1 Tax=Streptomyces mangrovisoli TaxID=1428628 RepID=A0A1J4NZ22_9ACTN|nr:TIGR03943 family protein [Streptomyces mangrovisoli]OIJ66485.1 TIGR03943 family protein [Streptomyces mangrovisoli]